MITTRQDQNRLRPPRFLVKTTVYGFRPRAEGASRDDNIGGATLFPALVGGSRACLDRLAVSCIEQAMRLRFILPLVLGLCLGSCGYIPRPVEGVPPGAPWEALPLRKWLAEDRAEPVALSFCAPPECAPGLVVGVVRLTGKDAAEAEAVLNDPSALERALRMPRKAAPGRTKPAGAVVAARPLREGPLRGFAISIAPADGGKHPAYGAALGRRSEGILQAVLVIGEDEASVLGTVLNVARRELRQ